MTLGTVRRNVECKPPPDSFIVPRQSCVRVGAVRGTTLVSKRNIDANGKPAPYSTSVRPLLTPMTKRVGGTSVLPPQLSEIGQRHGKRGKDAESNWKRAVTKSRCRQLPPALGSIQIAQVKWCGERGLILRGFRFGMCHCQIQVAAIATYC